MVEYYKTQKGYFYKKTQNGGSKRISNKDYEKNTKLKGGLVVSPRLSQKKQQKQKEQKQQKQQQQKLAPVPIPATIPVQDKLVLKNLMEKVNLETDDKIITEEINKYINNYEITVNDGKIVITKITKKGGDKQNKREKKNQKGGVNIDLKLLLKKLKCFGNPVESQNNQQIAVVNPVGSQNEQQIAIQEIQEVYNYMNSRYLIDPKKIKELQNNAKLPLSAFETLSDSIMDIPDYDATEMNQILERYYIVPCNAKQSQNNTNQSQSQNITTKYLKIYQSSVFIQLVIAMCAWIVNKFTFDVRRNANKIISVAYIVYLLALLVLQTLKKAVRMVRPN